ncbi:hypothetical protein IOD16_18320 [Saccharothrix sp. 6-C]|uniref:hypothetical protein n=1 Tax=Saccharothrix sp. 6-C TaxID=2781735 RepID=UPI001916D818|nr:hypothetical protein [Saccharothrix sp. 6-C]QQQ80165.1 hypothetical protein IOD16_18320 [Saccharothrix sp. 6-C]
MANQAALDPASRQSWAKRYQCNFSPHLFIGGQIQPMYGSAGQISQIAQIAVYSLTAIRERSAINSYRLAERIRELVPVSTLPIWSPTSDAFASSRNVGSVGVLEELGGR